MGEVVDGEYQKYTVMPGSYIREHFFGKYPELLELVSHLSDEKLKKLRRGGHDPEKVYAAYKAAVECKGRPTVILAKTIKGYGLGEIGEGRNATHQQKKLNEEELREFRSRFGIPISDEEVAKAPFYRPADDTPEMKYLHERREALGGYVPGRPMLPLTLKTPKLEEYQGVHRQERRPRSFDHDRRRDADEQACSRTRRSASTSCRSCPTNRAPSAWTRCSSSAASTTTSASFTSRSIPIRCSIIAKRPTARFSKKGSPRPARWLRSSPPARRIPPTASTMIPMFIYYSMFGFQRIGDLIWAALDCRARGFMFGGTAGRTTLAGEGLQHQDGNSQLFAIAYPNVRSYDPAFVYESTVIILDGMRRMYEDGEDAIYYITIGNENYEMPAMPEGVDRRDHPRHLQAFDARSRRQSAACATVRQRGDLARSAAGAEAAGREVRRVEHRVERDQLQGTAPRRPGRPPLEHAPSDREAAHAASSKTRSPA